MMFLKKKIVCVFRNRYFETGCQAYGNFSNYLTHPFLY
jgi:hypothetical protein